MNTLLCDMALADEFIIVGKTIDACFGQCVKEGTSTGVFKTSISRTRDQRAE